jgi:importin-4
MTVQYAPSSEQEVPILGKHIPELAQFLLQCGGNRAFDNELRVLALNALNWTVQ